MLEIKQILLPTDFSESSLEATQYGLELAQRFAATLHVLHVIEDPVPYFPMFESFPLPAREEFETYAQTRLENWILPDDVGKCDIQYGWVHGKTFVEILRAVSPQTPHTGTGQSYLHQQLSDASAVDITRQAQ